MALAPRQQARRRGRRAPGGESAPSHEAAPLRVRDGHGARGGVHRRAPGLPPLLTRPLARARPLLSRLPGCPRAASAVLRPVALAPLSGHALPLGASFPASRWAGVGFRGAPFARRPSAGPASGVPPGRLFCPPPGGGLLAQFPAPLSGSGVPPGRRCRLPVRRGCSRWGHLPGEAWGTSRPWFGVPSWLCWGQSGSVSSDLCVHPLFVPLGG